MGSFWQAIACGTAIAAALGGMYFMGKDVKRKEGVSSPYSEIYPSSSIVCA